MEVMKRISNEIFRRSYVMDSDFDRLDELSEQERADWDDMWMFNDISLAVSKQRNV